MAGNYDDAFASVNSFKDYLRDFDTGVFPEEIRPFAEQAKAKMESVLFDLGVSLEKKASDDTKVDHIQTDLRSQMEASPVFEGLSPELLTTLAESALESGKGVITEEQLADFVVHQLREMSDEDLLGLAYTPDEIQSVGQSVVRAPAQAFPRGKQIITEMMNTPVGREEAVTRAENVIRGDRDLTVEYLKAYYDVFDNEDLEPSDGEEKEDE